MSWPFLAGETPSAERLGEGPNTYTPVLTGFTTNPNLGADGSANGWWHRIGTRWVEGVARFNFAGTGANSGAGFLEVSLPLPADLSIMGAATSNNADTDPVGHGRIRSGTASSSRLTYAWLASATTLVMIADETNLRIEGDTVAWNRLWVKFSYLIEPGV